jgi:hypothetical protein
MKGELDDLQVSLNVLWAYSLDVNLSISPLLILKQFYKYD